MKTDKNGCSTCPPGHEHCEVYRSNFFSALWVVKVQYDYRSLDGVLFSCIANSLFEARQARDLWLKKHNQDVLKHAQDVLKQGRAMLRNP